MALCEMIYKTIWANFMNCKIIIKIFISLAKNHNNKKRKQILQNKTIFMKIKFLRRMEEQKIAIDFFYPTRLFFKDIL